MVNNAVHHIVTWSLALIFSWCVTNDVHAQGGLPRCYSPVENQTIFNEEVSLEWSSLYGESEDLYTNTRVQVSLSKSFETVEIDTIVVGNQLYIKSLTAFAEYFWRVKTLDEFADECGFDGYSFFKTSSVEVERTDIDSRIQLLTTHINGQEVLYVDNPANLPYDIKIVDPSDQPKFHQQCHAVKKGIATGRWMRGTYAVIIQSGDDTLLNTEITLH